MHLPESWKILVTGVTSIHGWPIFAKLQKLLPPSRLRGIAPPKYHFSENGTFVSMCITDRSKLENIKHDFNPTHVIHCAGVCDLDICEERPQWAHAINVNGTKNVVDVFGKDASMLYMSTDLVYSGIHPHGAGYSEDDRPNPISIAGKTFAMAEHSIAQCKNHCIVRLGLPLGQSFDGKKGALDWIEGRFKRSLPVTLFYDEFRSCIDCKEIGNVVLKIVYLQLKGLFHFGGEKTWSLYDIGEYILQRKGYQSDLLNGITRQNEKKGPPRIGNVSLNSNKLKNLLKSQHSMASSGSCS